ncbi:MAG: flagellar hook-length control protein FliK, partial [Planctomycetota bacterium]
AGAAQPGAAPTLRAESASQASRSQAAAPKPGAAAMERAEAILDQLRMRIRAGDREATIQLRPADLGRLQMHVRVDGGAISATIAAESPETLAVLEAHAPELRSWLARDDAQRVDLQLELLVAADAEEHAAHERAQEQGDGRRDGRRRGSADRDPDAALAAAPDALARALAHRSAEGGVDLVA